jgi:hypothetical protein
VLLDLFGGPPHRLVMRTRQATSADTPFLRDLHHRAYHDVVLRQLGQWDLADGPAAPDLVLPSSAVGARARVRRGGE